MINVQNLDKSYDYLSDEKQMLQHDPDSLRTFYSLTGPARKEYVIQIAEAEAERIKIVRQAQADGLLAVRKAEAEGFCLIGEAMKGIENKEQVMQLAGLMALQEVAESLANGKATKLFLPQKLSDVFSMLGVLSELYKTDESTVSTVTTEE